jgi:hypothetical protein
LKNRLDAHKNQKQKGTKTKQRRGDREIEGFIKAGMK